MTNRVGGVSGWAVYGRSWAVALTVAVLLSWGMMQIIALVLERRTLLNPFKQYPTFWYGDLIVLPGLVLVLRYLSQHVAPNQWWQSWVWHVACLVLGLLVGLIFHRMEASNYTASELNSPTKLYHDLVVFPLYIYLLVSAAPVLFASRGHVWVARGLALVFILVFVGLNLHDSKPENRKPNAHIAYDWLHMRPVNHSGSRR